MVEAATTAGLVVIAQSALRLAESALAKRKEANGNGEHKGHGERLAAIEAQLEGVGQRLDRIEHRLDK